MAGLSKSVQEKIKSAALGYYSLDDYKRDSYHYIKGAEFGYELAQAQAQILVKAITSGKSLARHIIETAQRDGWSSRGLEFSCSVLERDLEKALSDFRGES